MKNGEEIYNQYSNVVYKYLLCLTQDDELSQDLTQETFAIALNKIDNFRYECKLSVWLCQIAKNLWYNHLKKAKKENHIPLENIENRSYYENNTEDIVMKNDEKLRLFKKIQALETPFRDVIYLRMNGNLSFSEIAEIFGKTTNWARVTFFRAKKKIEKEVEDLILPYIEETLNGETKDLVEKHLQNCDKCKHKVEEFKSNIIENKENDKKCIDYLKKAKRKERIRTIKWIILLILFIIVIMYLRNTIIVNSILNKSKKSLSHNNIYIQSMRYEPNNETIVTKEYYKDGKYKITTESYSNDNITLLSTKYADVNTGDSIYVDEKTKKISLSKGLYLFNEEQAKELPFIDDDKWTVRTILPAFISIKSKKFENGSYYNENKSCYVLKYDRNWEIWFDKKTGLPIKEIEKNASKSYYTNTGTEEDSENTIKTLKENPSEYIKQKNDILKKIGDRNTEYRYEFDIVTDEDVKVPEKILNNIE